MSREQIKKLGYARYLLFRVSNIVADVRRESDDTELLKLESVTVASEIGLEKFIFKKRGAK